jgi:hypothetical protein
MYLVEELSLLFASCLLLYFLVVFVRNLSVVESGQFQSLRYHGAPFGA